MQDQSKNPSQNFQSPLLQGRGSNPVVFASTHAPPATPNPPVPLEESLEAASLSGNPGASANFGTAPRMPSAGTTVLPSIISMNRSSGINPVPEAPPAPIQSTFGQDALPIDRSFGARLTRFGLANLKKLAFVAVGVFALLILGLGIYLIRDQSAVEQPKVTPAKQADSEAIISSANDTQSLHLNRDTIVDQGKLLRATGQVILQNTVDSDRALAVQNAAGDLLFNVDTTGKSITIGSDNNTITLQIAGAVSIVGDLSVNTLRAGAATIGNQGVSLGALTVCSTDGCIPNTRDAVSLQGENASFYTNASNLTSGTLSDSRLSTNVALLNASQTFTGFNTLKPTTNSTAAFQVQNASGTNIFSVDTANGRVGIGVAPANGVLTIGTNANTTSSGGIYFGTDTYLHRSQPGQLVTNGALASLTGIIQALSSTNDAVTVGYANGGVTAGISFGIAADTSLYRANPGVLQTNNNFVVNGGKLGVGTGTPTDTLTVVGNGLIQQSALSAPSLTLSGNEITDAIRLSGVQGDGKTYPDSSFGIWEGTTNLNPNGGMETNTTGWAASGSATISRDATTAKFGSASLKSITNGAAADEGATTGTNGTLGMTGITTYTVSAWVKGSGSIILTAKEYDNSHVFIRRDDSSPLSLTPVWQKLVVSFTTHTNTRFGDILIVTNSSQAVTFWADGIQLEQKDGSTPYVETNGVATSRNTARVRGPTADLDEVQGWVATRIRAGQPSSLCMEGGTERIFEWTASDSDRILLNYNCGASRFEALRIGSGFATVTPVNFSFSSGDQLTVVMAWTASVVKLSVNGAAFSSQPGTSIPDLSAITFFDLGSSLGTTAHLDGDILWFAAGTGTMTDSDPATLHGLGNTDPNMTTFVSASAPSLVWQANNAFYLDKNYQPVVLNVQNSLGQSIFGIDAGTTSILMPGLTSASSALILGNDVNLYRSAADTLKTDDSLVVAGNTTINGAVLAQNSLDSTTAFQIQNATGAPLFVADTTNLKITLGSPSATPVILVLGTKNTAGDPTCTAGALYYNSSTNQTKTCINGAWAAAGVPTVTALPASPSDGDEVYYIPDSTNYPEVKWHLRYNAGSASIYKWEYLGGNEIRTNGTATIVAGVQTAITGANFTLPRAGDYQGHLSAMIGNIPGTGGAQQSVTLAFGSGTGTFQDGSVQLYAAGASAGGQLILDGGTPFRIIGASSGAVVRPQAYASSVGGTSPYPYATSSIYIRPIRLN